jgi:hypothetical protein
VNAIVDMGVLDIASEFFAPTSTDMVHGLVAEYRRDRQLITDAVAMATKPDFRSVWHYFTAGNATEERGRTSLEKSVEQMFREEGAICALNAAYWSKALSLTDVYDAMPQARRTQWNEQIRYPEGVRKDYQEVRRERDNHPERVVIFTPTQPGSSHADHRTENRP